MTPENFCYFLQGYLETSDPEYIDSRRTIYIKEKLLESLKDHGIKPDYYIGDPNNPIPMMDSYDENDIRKPRLIC